MRQQLTPKTEQEDPKRRHRVSRQKGLVETNFGNQGALQLCLHEMTLLLFTVTRV